MSAPASSAARIPMLHPAENPTLPGLRMKRTLSFHGESARSQSSSGPLSTTIRWSSGRRDARSDKTASSVSSGVL